MNRSWTEKIDWTRDPLVVALCLSLSLHFLIYGLYRAGNAFGWWDVSIPFIQKILSKLSSPVVDQQKIEEALKQQLSAVEEELPLMFVDVTPDQASTEAPENAKFYGASNSQAANPDPVEEEAEMPEIDGEQEKVIRTQDIAQNVIQDPVTPTPPVEEPVEDEEEPINPDQLQPEPQTPVEDTGQENPTRVAEEDVEKPGSPDQLELPQPLTPKPGDLAMREVRPQPEKGDGALPEGNPEVQERPQRRPRTIAEARQLQPQKSQIAGQKMRQEGGVRRQSIVPSLDTLGTPFGVYDAWFIAQVQQRWYFLLEKNPAAYNWAGHVKVSFRLYYDGRITDFKFEENNSGDIQGLLCQKAIIENVPYRSWPPDLRRMVNKDYRELRFTFYYN